MDGHFQTPSDKTNVAGIIPIADQSVIVNLGTTYRVLFEFEKSEKYLKRFSEENTKSSCLLYTSPSPRDATLSRMPSSA